MALSTGCSLMKSRPMWNIPSRKEDRDLMPIFYEIMVWGFKHEKDDLKNPDDSKRDRK